MRIVGREIDRGKIDNETREQINEGDRLGKLGAKFASDKKKLENEIEKVENSTMSGRDKALIIAELNAAIEKLQEQYNKDVADEEAKVQGKIQGKLEQMDDAIDEIDQKAASLRSVVIEAASTDASSAADAAEAKKREFEEMKEDYAEKLRLQKEQSGIQQRNIRERRLR